MWSITVTIIMPKSFKNPEEHCPRKSEIVWSLHKKRSMQCKLENSRQHSWWKRYSIKACYVCFIVMESALEYIASCGVQTCNVRPMTVLSASCLEFYHSPFFLNSPKISKNVLLVIYIHVPHHKFLYYFIHSTLFFTSHFVPSFLKLIISFPFISEKTQFVLLKKKCKVNLI